MYYKQIFRGLNYSNYTSALSLQSSLKYCYQLFKLLQRRIKQSSPKLVCSKGWERAEEDYFGDTFKRYSTFMESCSHPIRQKKMVPSFSPEIENCCTVCSLELKLKMKNCQSCVFKSFQLRYTFKQTIQFAHEKLNSS